MGQLTILPNGNHVTQSAESIIYTTGRAVFFLDKEDLSITQLTRDDGLAETEIRLLRFHPPTNTLIIVYENSVIDLFRDGRFSTLRQIDNFNFSGGDNSVRDLFFGEGNVVYIAAGYGISALNLDDETFLFTTFTGVGVEGVALFENNLYAATEEGIYRVARSGVNLNDFGNWDLLGPEVNLPADYSSTAINVWRGDLYFAINEDVWRWNDGQPSLHYDAETLNYQVQYLSAGPFYLLAGYQRLPGGNNDRQVVLVTETGFDREVRTNCVQNANYAIETDDAQIWFGDDGTGIRYLPRSGSETCEQLFYPGPITDRNYRMEHDGTALWVAGGTLTPNLSPIGRSEGLYRFRDGEWTTFNRNTRSELAGRDQVNGNFDDLVAMVGVAIDP
ncbi:MAG: hypothetical protein AAFU03_14160, partial [Bacteroidota bacterium]